MRTIKLDEILLDFDGKELLDHEEKPLSVGRAISQALVGESPDPLRSYVLAADIYKSTTIDLNESDYDFVVSQLKSSKRWTTLVTGQLLQRLSDKKDVE